MRTSALGEVTRIMSINRTRSWLVVCAVLLGGASMAYGQHQFGEHEHPFDVHEYHDFQPFAPADLSEFGNGPKADEGWFFSYERVMWNVTPPDKADIGSPGAITNEIIDGLPFMSGNGADNGFMTAEMGWANRYEFGYMANDCGWLVSTIGDLRQTETNAVRNVQIGFDDPNGILRSFVDLDLDGFDDDLDGDSIFGRDGVDVGRPGTVVIAFTTTTTATLPPVTTVTAVTAPGFVPPKDGTPDRPFNAPDAVNDSFFDENGNGIQDVGEPNTSSPIINLIPNPAFDSTLPPVGTNVPFIPILVDSGVDNPDDLNGGFENGTNADLGDTIIQQPIFPNLYVYNLVEVDGVEVMRTWRWPTLHYGGTLEIYGGVRYLAIDDTFQLWDRHLRSLILFEVDHKVDNHIVGPQMGLRWSRRTGRWTVSAEGRFMAGANFRSINQEGYLGVPGTNIAGGFKNSLDDNEFSPVGEVRLDFAYQLTKAVSLKAGYTGTVVGGIARASNTVLYSLPQLDIRPPTEEELVMNGINFGIEVNR